MSIWAHRFFLSAMVCAPFLVLQRKYIQNHGRKLLPRPPRNQGQSKQYHQLKQPRNTKREAPLAVRFELPAGASLAVFSLLRGSNHPTSRKWPFASPSRLVLDFVL